MTYVLYDRPGWGSVLVETQLVWYGLPYERVPVANFYEDDAARAAFAPINPAGQLPALILPDKRIMTESAAITLYLADVAKSDALVPAPDAAERADFLRWLVFLVVQVYAPFVVADRAEKFVPDAAAAKALAANVQTYRENMWRIVESVAGSPWFLGSRFTALDIFVCAMRNWKPRRPWFEANAPKLAAIAAKTEALPNLAPIWTRNFPPA
jgi:GST-like protein